MAAKRGYWLSTHRPCSPQPGVWRRVGRYAGQNRRRDTTATWVIVDARDIVAAYATLR